MDDMNDFPDDYENSPAYTRWQDQLAGYLATAGQQRVTMLRGQPAPNSPWPDLDNPMLGYLVDRALEHMEATDDKVKVLMWLATHAWFEGAIDVHARQFGAVDG